MSSNRQSHPTFSLSKIFPETPVMTIVDIGASVGDRPEPYENLVNSGHARAIAFEPNLAEHKKLQDLNRPGITVLPYFVGDGLPATYFETNAAMTGSLFEPHSELLKKFQNLEEVTQLRASHAVQTKRIDEISEIPDIDFLKIDVQGAELAVLKGGGQKLRQCVVAQIEVEFVALYKEQPLFADVDAYMRETGWSFHTFQYFGSRCFKPFFYEQQPNRGQRQILWSDAVYIRDFMTWETLPDSKLINLAILAHDLLGSHDLCAAALQELDLRYGGVFTATYSDLLQRSASSHASGESDKGQT